MRKESKVAKKVVPKQTLATTTPLVKDMFDAMFGGQIDDKALKEIKKRRCGVCEVGAYHLFLTGDGMSWFEDDGHVRGPFILCYNMSILFKPLSGPN